MAFFLFAEYRISMLFLLLFVLAFSVKRYSLLKTCLILFFCFALTCFPEIVDFFIHGRRSYSAPTTAIQIALVQLTVLWVSRYRDFRALFVGFSAPCYVLIGNLFCTMSYIYVSNYIVSILFQVFVHSIALFILIKMIRKEFCIEQVVQTDSWGLLCMIPAAFYTISFALMAWPINIYETPQVATASFLIMLLMIFVYIIIVQLFARRRNENELKRNNDFLEVYASCLKREAAQIEKREEAISFLRHDFHHKINLLETYLDAGEYEKIREMIELNEKSFFPKEERYCDNTAVNGIVRSWAENARQSHVMFVSQIDVPKAFSDNQFEFELATVLSNLLENAVYASKNIEDTDVKSFVSFTMNRNKGRLVIEIVNSFNGICELDSETNLPPSKRGDGHGYGLRSVKSFTEKHHAIFDYTIESETVTVRILVPYESKKTGIEDEP